jgi:uncharacterized membrane protein YqjE
MEIGFFFFLILFLKDDRWSLLKFVVVTFDFCYTNDYTIASDMFLLVIGSIRGWCWKLMTNRKKSKL